MKKILLALLLLPLFSNAQIITTIIGTGAAGYSGNGGVATAAEISSPGYVTVDRTGNIYIADQGNNVIRMVNTSGIISTFAGNNTASYSGDGNQATAAGLYVPKAIAFDKSGNAYIADAYNYVIRKIDTSGIISTIAGNNINGYMGDGGPATAAELSDVHSVGVDDSDNVFIADFSNHVVRKVNTAGIISTFAGNGTLGYSGDGGPATVAELNNPTDIAFDASGNVYIADARSYTVRIVNASGTINTFAGTGTSGYSGDNGPATAAYFNLPHAVAVDDSNNVYIADAGNNVIRKVSTSGIVNTIAGNGGGGYSGDGVPATATSLNSPYGIAFDTSHNIYIADLSNNRIREIVKHATSIKNITNVPPVIMLFPNPAATQLTISASSSINEIIITNLVGQTVYSWQFTVGSLPTGQAGLEVNVDVSGLPSGVYLVKVNSVVRKFVKE